jgi:hypothetical protein
MRKKTCGTLLALLLCTTLALPAGAQEAEAMPQMPDEAAMQAAWEKAMTPGEPHHLLSQMAGEWSFENTLWMAPGAPPTKSVGTAVKTMIMDGRYLQEEMHGDMMGTPFKGRGVTGYDNITDTLKGTWIDSMSTNIAFTTGSVDLEKHTYTMGGEMVDPLSGTALEHEMVTTVKDKDHHLFEYFILLPDGERMKQMEILYIRKGSEGDMKGSGAESSEDSEG